MTLSQSIRVKLENKLFNKLGTPLYIQNYNVSDDNYGGYECYTKTLVSEEEVIGVPYNYTAKELSNYNFGDLDNGDMIVVFRYTDRDKLNLDSILKFNDELYKVVNIEEWVLSGDLIAFACKLVKLKE